ncbi:DsbA family protein [Patulibacter minatonensis]|uniref:DsbA family protein n=1 Tax=Patulibacter minatonensis TaxID=298163 RepID=UPI00047DDCD5|nr:thioredoxin domain-containing protein [Patulibacter minatonensis]
MSRPGSPRPVARGTTDPEGRLLTRRTAIVTTVASLATATSAALVSGAPSAALAATPAYPGVREHGNLLGRASAPVRIVLFADLKCPACRSFEQTELGTVVRRLVRPGRAAIELHLVDIIDGNVGTHDGARLRTTALNLASRNRLWRFAREVLRRQGDETREWATPARLVELGRLAGAPVGAGTMRETAASRRAARADDQRFSRLEATGTPALYVRRRDGGSTLAVSNTSARGIEEAVARLERGGTR